MLSLYELIIRSPTKDKRRFASGTAVQVLFFFCRLLFQALSFCFHLSLTHSLALFSLSLPLVPARYPWPGNKNNLSCGELGDKDRRSWRVLGVPVAKRRSTVLLRGVCYQGGSILLGSGCPVYLQLMLPVGLRSDAWGWLVCNGRWAPKETGTRDPWN